MFFGSRLTVTVMVFLLGANNASAQMLTTKTRAGIEDRDLILYNGKIFTSVEDQLWVEALWVKGPVIKATGSSDEVLAMAGKNTEKINLEGKLVIPGINDAHAHSFVGPEHVMLNDPGEFVPNEGPGVDEFMGMLAEKVKDVEKGKWIFGVMGTRFFDDPRATRQTLDAVAPDHPVMFQTWGGHGRVINTYAMNQAGISINEPDPPGGEYLRDATGALTGVLHEYAEHHLARYFKSITPVQEARNQYEAFARGLVSFGVTTVQDMDIGYSMSSSEFVLSGVDLPLHWRVICFPLTPEESCRGSIRQHLFKNGPIRAYTSGVKYILDGSPIEGYAALRDPYSNIENWTGVFNWNDELATIIAQAMEGNPRANQLLFHAVGDRATDRILAEMEKTGTPEFWRTRRLRIEHGAILWPEQIAKMAEYGVVFVHNPIFTSAAELISSRFGEERARHYQPVRSALEAGIMVGFGSDTGGIPGYTYLELALSLFHFANPSEKITLEQGLIAYTLGSAYAEFQEKIKGTLEKGKLADLAVLSHDIFQIRDQLPETPEGGDINNLIGQFLQVQSVFTMVAGSIAHDSGVLKLD